MAAPVVPFQARIEVLVGRGVAGDRGRGRWYLEAMVRANVQGSNRMQKICRVLHETSAPLLKELSILACSDLALGVSSQHRPALSADVVPCQ